MDQTIGKKRPRSRGPMAHMHNAAAHSSMDPATYGGNPAMYHFTQGSNNGMEGMDVAVGHQLAYQQQLQQLQQPQQLQQSQQQSWVDDTDAHLEPMSRGMLDVVTAKMHGMDGQDGNSMAAVVGAPKQTSARSSANNEIEMRQLFHNNRDRTLDDVAREIQSSDHGPNYERSRQLFGMLWINKWCGKGGGSVPRNRVYATYARSCAEEKVTVLNPASFGKLVRVLFPGLKTRRLGVRGMSKYHYVDFHISKNMPLPPIDYFNPDNFKADSAEPSLEASLEAPSLPQDNDPSPIIDSIPALPADTGVSTSARAPINKRSMYLAQSFDDRSGGSKFHELSKVSLEPAFMSLTSPDASGALHLPEIEPFLPRACDRDSAHALSTLYLSHCTSLVQDIRYCKVASLHRTLAAFMGTLTTPVRELLAKPELAPWIEACDTASYRCLMHMINSLVLQVMPQQILEKLRLIAEGLVPHIQQGFENQPAHLLRAKLGPATFFVSLLRRALRANITAHAAAQQLANPANRDQMYVDWVTMIDLRHIAESVPECAMDDCLKLLTEDMRSLLNPQSVPMDVDCLTIYGTNESGDQQKEGTSTGGSSGAGDEILDRWVKFIENLPKRFPNASALQIVQFTHIVGTKIVADLTISSARSFTSWWSTKVWLDELIQYMADLGGFFQRPLPGPLVTAKEPEAPQEQVDLDGGSGSQPGRAPFPSANKVTGAGAPEAHDDSGISGISIPSPEETHSEEEFSVD